MFMAPAQVKRAPSNYLIQKHTVVIIKTQVANNYYSSVQVQQWLCIHDCIESSLSIDEFELAT